MKAPHSAESCPDPNVVVALLERRLDEEARAHIDAHVDRCAECRELIAAMSEDDGRAEQPTLVGRAPREPHARRSLLRDTNEPLLGPRERVDHFRVIRRLGRGGMGEVYLARDTKLGRRVALKLIAPSLLGSPQMAQRFLLEARTTARFSHPNIVTVYAVGEHRGFPYLTLEYVQGQNLRERMREHRLGLPEIVSIVLDVAEALAEAHRHSVLHCDLKPANVVIPRDGRARVVDFGLATLLHPSSGQARSEKRRTIAGTPAYLAPEQWQGLPAGPAVDIWALGVLLFELCAGRRPYDTRDTQELSRAVLDPTPTPNLGELCDVPAPIVELAARCLRKSAEERPRAAHVAETLRALVHAPSPSTLSSDSPFRGLLLFARARLHRQSVVYRRPKERIASSTGSARLNFRAPDSRFVGRRKALANLRSLLDQTRFVTIVGPPGAGKTRLAMEHAAAAIGEDDIDAARFVDLGEARTDADLHRVAAHALGVPLTGDDSLDRTGKRIGALLAKAGRMLVLLDNAEQLAEGTGSWVAAWLEAAPELRVVVTSRRALALPGECLLQLGTLRLPAPDAVSLEDSSSQLFVERAREVRPEYAPSAEEVPIIMELVRRLDGLPLAIELAAARMSVMGPAQLLDRLGHGEELRGERYGRPVSLEHTIAWSWDLLSPAERLALAQLSVTRGGFDANAAEAVIELSSLDGAPPRLEVVEGLRRHSLLIVADTPGLPGERRFGMLDAIRGFAHARLEELGDAARGHHARHYLDAATRWSEQVEKSDGPAALTRLGLELANLVEVHKRAIERHDAVQSLGVVLALDHLFYMRGPTSMCLELLDAALRIAEQLGLRTQQVALALKARGRVLNDLGRLEEATRDLERAHTLAMSLGDRALCGRILGHLATLRHDENDFAAAADIARRGLADSRAVGDERTEGMLLGMLANTLMALGDLNEAESTYDQALALHRRVDNFYSVGFCLMHRAELVRRRGKAYFARRDLEQAIEVFRTFGERRHEGEALLKLCLLKYQSGEIGPARGAAERGAELFREHGSARLESYALEHIGALWHAEGELEEAARVYQQALGMVDRSAAARVLGSLASVEITRGRLEAARAALADAVDLDADDTILRVARARLALADGDRALASQISKELREPAVPVPEVLVSRGLLEQAFRK